MKQHVRVYMKSGSIIEFSADDFSLTYNGDMEATGYKYKGVDKTLLWMSVDSIEAVTSEGSP